MNIYLKFGFENYYIALGYKGHIIYNYFSKRKITEKSYTRNNNFFKQLKFSLNGVNIGTAVYDQYIRFTGIGTIDHFNPNIQIVKKNKIYKFLIQKKYKLVWSGHFSHIFESK